MTGIRIDTARLSLRPLPAAAAALLGHDRRAAAALIGASLAPEWPLPDLVEALPMQVASPDDKSFGIWTMVEASTAMVVGDVGFMGPPDGEGAIETGYSVVPDRRRRGYAGEALAAVLGWAAQQPGVRTVTARCDPDNAASIRTLRRTGFVPDGEADGMACWSLRLGS